MSCACKCSYCRQGHHCGSGLCKVYAPIDTECEMDMSILSQAMQMNMTIINNRKRMRKRVRQRRKLWAGPGDFPDDFTSKGVTGTIRL